MQNFDTLTLIESVKMRQVPKADLLDALRQSLREVENLKLISPGDLDILDLRRILKERIAAMEGQSEIEEVNG